MKEHLVKTLTDWSKCFKAVFSAVEVLVVGGERPCAAVGDAFKGKASQKQELINTTHGSMLLLILQRGRKSSS